jgi:hypothetical protein
MPGFSASISVFGDKQFERELRFVGRRATHAKPLYEELGWFLSYRVMGEQFRTEGARSGQPWAPLAPSTIKRKGHPTILVNTGRLRESFKLWDVNNIYHATDDYLRYGSDVEEGAFHQPDKQQRRVFSLTEHDRDHIVKEMQHWVIKGELRG